MLKLNISGFGPKTMLDQPSDVFPLQVAADRGNGHLRFRAAAPPGPSLRGGATAGSSFQMESVRARKISGISSVFPGSACSETSCTGPQRFPGPRAARPRSAAATTRIPAADTGTMDGTRSPVPPLVSRQVDQQFRLEMEGLVREDFVLQQPDGFALLGEFDGLHGRPVALVVAVVAAGVFARHVGSGQVRDPEHFADHDAEGPASALPALALGNHAVLQVVDGGVDQLDAILGVFQRIAQVEEMDPRIGVQPEVFVRPEGQLGIGSLGGDLGQFLLFLGLALDRLIGVAIAQ